MTLGSRLFEARSRKGWSQLTLASTAFGSGTTWHQCISAYERDHQVPTVTRLVMLCRALEVSADWLLGLDVENVSSAVSAADSTTRTPTR